MSATVEVFDEAGLKAVYQPPEVTPSRAVPAVEASPSDEPIGLPGVASHVLGSKALRRAVRNCSVESVRIATPAWESESLFFLAEQRVMRLHHYLFQTEHVLERSFQGQEDS